MTTTHVVISNDAHPDCTTFNIETATSTVQPCILLSILHDYTFMMQLTLQGTPTITRVHLLGVDTECERKVPQERLDRVLARCRDLNESAMHTQEVCLLLLNEIREMAANQTVPQEIRRLVSVEQLPTKSSSYSLLAVVGAHTNALPLAAVAHMVFLMGTTVLSMNLDTSKGMAVTILALQLKGEALPASVMKEALKQLYESIVVPVTVHHVQNTQGKFQAPSLTTPAAVDQWSRERNAWVHSLVYSAKAATDKVAAGTLTLAPVEGFKCVSEEQEDQARRGLEMQMRRKGMEAGTHGVAGLMRIMRCDPYAGSKSPKRERRESTGKDGMTALDGSAEPKPASSLAGEGAAAGLIHPGVRKNIEAPKTHLAVGGSLHGTNNAMRVLSMNSHRSEQASVFSSAPVLPSKSALSMLSKPVKNSPDEKKSYMSLAKQMFLGSHGKKESDLSSLSAKGSSSVHGGMQGSQIQRSSTMVLHTNEGEGSKPKKPSTMPLRHNESFSKRQCNAWYSMPWVTQADPTTKEGCWEAPGPGEFEVKCQIGEGLTSSVYLARIKRANEFSSGLDSKCVLKVMRKDHKLLDGQLVGHVAERELRILSDLQSSPFVIRMFGTFSTDQYLFLVTEWAPCDMFQLMTDNFGSYRFWCNVRIYAGQVLLALEHLHQAGYIYCDLKPENLLVCHDGSVKVSDMGLAVRFPEPGKLLYRMCGTSEYMSPEMVSRKGYSYMTDIWSFGVFVYELLTCSTPFQAGEGEPQGNAHVVERLRDHTKITFPPDVTVEKAAKDLTFALLTRAVDKRLGAKDPPGDYQSIKSQPWFADMNWKALARGLHTPSIFPRFAPETMIRSEGKLPWMEHAE